MNLKEIQLSFRIGIARMLKKHFPRAVAFLKNIPLCLNEQWKRMPMCIQVFWFNRQWWIALFERKIFSERWLDARRRKKIYQSDKRAFLLQMISWSYELKRPLSDFEREELEEYERRYNRIEVFFIGSGFAIPRLCYDYSFLANESRQGDNGVCRVLFFEGMDSAHITTNAYLCDKLRATFPTITRKNFAFWYTYLMKNHKQVFVRTTIYHVEKLYEWSYKFFTTGEPIIHPKAVMFSEKEIQIGQDAMQRLGIVNPYICIFARDARYNNEMRHTRETWRDLRNSDINAFKKTTQYFWENNIQTVRMGALAYTKYCVEGAVDYTNQGRTEFLDVFIFSKCRFYIGDCSGIYGLAYLQNIPWAAINIHVPIYFGDGIQDAVVGIYLKYYDFKNKRFLRLREIAEMQLHYYPRLSFQQASGGEGWGDYMYRNYKVIHNTPEEILDLAKEMEAIQAKTIKYTAHDEELQRRYRSIIRNYLKIYPTVICPNPCRLGMKWLRDNEWFLE